MTVGRDEIRHDSVEWRGVTIAYSWCHSRRRSLGMTVRPGKSVAVRVPLRTPLKEVRAFVVRRAEWVLKVWKQQDEKPVQQQQDYGHGALFMFQGQVCRLEFATGAPRSCGTESCC